METLINPSLLRTYTCLSMQASPKLDSCLKQNTQIKLVLYLHSLFVELSDG
uniref:Uncharacterized protein n=1 Tax=Arundo donax TaxID=35708 RepID=A0A0A9BLX5_ARUDO